MNKIKPLTRLEKRELAYPTLWRERNNQKGILETKSEVLRDCQEIHSRLLGQSDPIFTEELLQIKHYLKTILDTWSPLLIGRDINLFRFDICVHSVVLATLEEVDNADATILQSPRNEEADISSPPNS